MIIFGTWFSLKKKTKTHPNTKFHPIFNGRNNDLYVIRTYVLGNPTTEVYYHTDLSHWNLQKPNASH